LAIAIRTAMASIWKKCSSDHGLLRGLLLGSLVFGSDCRAFAERLGFDLAKATMLGDRQGNCRRWACLVSPINPKRKERDMYIRIMTTLVACVASLTWALAYAQQQSEQSDQPKEQQTQMMSEQQKAGEQQQGFHVEQQAAKCLRASKLIGLKAWNPQNQELGQIDDLVVDMPSGKIKFAILSSGGVLGIGEKLHAVPIEFTSLRWDAEHNSNYLVLDLTQDQLRNAPSFTSNSWPDFSSEQVASSIRGFYQKQVRTVARPVEEEKR
jgi:sporulation protein YlmC with PRC-barrel domain